MNETFRIAFRLRMAYRINALIFTLKSLPLIKKLLPSTLYASRSLKRFAGVVCRIWGFIAMFLWKAVYVFPLIFILAPLYRHDTANTFLHIFTVLTIIGGFLNTRMFNPTKDKYYAIFLMRMHASSYAISDYLLFLAKTLIGFLPVMLIFGRLSGLSLLTCLLMPVFVCCVKLLFTAASLVKPEPGKKIVNENKPIPFVIASTVILLVAAYLLPYFDIVLIPTVFNVLTLILIIPAFISLHRILRFPYYREIYRQLLNPDEMMMLTGSKEASLAMQQKAMQKKIDANVTVTSNKTGYRYFNELFMKRHSKLLTKSVKRISYILLVVFAVLVGICFIFPDSKADLNLFTLKFLPYFAFVMYIINRGRAMAQAMFMNCDHSMLTYRFYRQPKAILLLFTERLKYVTAYNLIPACIIGLGLPLLLFVSGGTDNPLNYLMLLLSILAMSVFFSIHNVTMYYLLQPYNIQVESKGAAYTIVDLVVYFLCYGLIGKQIPTLYFGAGATAFCLLYAVFALFLAFKLAPKTFKLR